ncbi:MAG TPA: hypothetical protein PKY87_09430 [Terricaulis sp.]|nr:hypothetical protein [Terricaulis sp.]
MRLPVFALCALALAACAQEPAPAKVEAPDVTETIAASDVPTEVLAAARAAVPDFIVAEAERKEREGRIYFDLEGARPDGSEAEIDLLQTPQGWVAVEIQRDIAWADAPEPVRAAAAAAPGAFAPVRVIESTQVEDGAVIYELFAEGRPEAPSMEVRVADGQVAVLTEANPH